MDVKWIFKKKKIFKKKFCNYENKIHYLHEKSKIVQIERNFLMFRKAL